MTYCKGSRATTVSPASFSFWLSSCWLTDCHRETTSRQTWLSLQHLYSDIQSISFDFFILVWQDFSGICVDSEYDHSTECHFWSTFWHKLNNSAAHSWNLIFYYSIITTSKWRLGLKHAVSWVLHASSSPVSKRKRAKAAQCRAVLAD